MAQTGKDEKRKREMELGEEKDRKRERGCGQEGGSKDGRQKQRCAKRNPMAEDGTMCGCRFTRPSDFRELSVSSALGNLSCVISIHCFSNADPQWL